jgi:hypothetical protein
LISSKSTDIVTEHYETPDIKNTILRWALGRSLNGNFRHWYEQEENHIIRLINPETDYINTVNKYRVLYSTLNIFTPETFNRRTEWDIENKCPKEKIGSYEETDAYTLSVDIDAKNLPDNENITNSVRIREGIELACKFFVDKLNQAGVHKSVHCLYSGGGAYIHIHHELTKPSKPFQSNEDRAMYFAMLTGAFNKYISIVEKEFIDAYPQYQGIIAFDKLNSEKRIFKTIFSIHKKFNIIVIPINRDDPKIDIKKAKFPLKQDILDLGKTWYTEFDYSERAALLTLLDPLSADIKYSSTTKLESKPNRQMFKSKIKISINEFKPCLLNIINKANPGAGKHRCCLILAAALYQHGWNFDDAFKLWLTVAGRCGIDNRTDIFYSSYGVLKMPTCINLNKEGEGYPKMGIGDLKFCNPDNFCDHKNLIVFDKPKETFKQLNIETSKPKKSDNKKTSSEPAKDSKKKPSQAEILIDLAEQDNVEFWHTPDHEQYATVVENGHNENMAINSSSFKRWLSWKMFSGVDGKVPGSQALQDAINTMGGKAEFLGEELATFVRVAEKDGKIYVDIGDVDWNAIEISGGSWKLIANPPVKFVRPKGLLPLVMPERGGNINDLRCLLNAGDDDTWMLIVAWMLQAFWPRGPYAHLSLGGEQGTLKSTMTRMIKMIIDPSTTALRRMPKNEEDMMIAAKRERVLSFDNLSGIGHEMSDSLCCLSTGGSLGKRALYENDEEHSITAMRPAIMNGIDALTSRGDLLDRTIIIDLPVVDQKNRKSIEDIDVKFNKIRPKILGALLDITAKGWDTKIGNIENLPRMADFARWILACEAHLPWKKGRFLKVYHESKCNAIGDSISGNKFAMAIKDYTGKHYANPDKVSNIIPTVLFKNLCEQEGFSSNFIPKGIGWPSSPSAMSKLLNRMSAGLRQQRVIVTQHKSDGVRYISLACREKSHPK